MDNLSINFAILEKSYSCSCCCLGRPEMVGKFNDGTEYGRIIQPFNGCKNKFEIYDSSNELKYIIIFDCCECKLFDYKANIYDKNNENLAIGTIVKKKFIKEYMINGISIEVIFPNNATPQDKMLIISNILFIYNIMFDDEKPENMIVVN